MRKVYYKETMSFREFENIYLKAKEELGGCEKFLFRRCVIYDIPMSLDDFTVWIKQRFLHSRFSHYTFKCAKTQDHV